MADGRLVECDEHHNEELFWALRGAGGGNFGVVTSFVFRTLPAPLATVFHLVWPLAQAADVAQGWQAWAPTGPDELDATMRMTASGDGERPPVVELFGAVLGSERDAAKLLEELIARAGADPASASHGPMLYREAKRYLNELDSGDDQDQQAAPDQRPQQRHLFTKSEFFRRPLPIESIAALVENFTRRLVPGQSREVAFLPWGGAYNRVRSDATAFIHRDELFLIQHLLAIDPDASVIEREAARDWLTRSWGLVHPSGSGGVYPNFPDPDLDDGAQAYYGKNYDRLLRIKATYDPDNFFGFH